MDVAGYKLCVSDCITQAAMLSPPVLHFVILSLGSCLAYLLLSKFNQILYKREKK